MSDLDDKKSKRLLTPRETKFVEVYLSCSNASQAARAAGYAENNIRHIAHQIKKRPHVAAAIAAVRSSMIEKGKYDLEKAMEDAEETYSLGREERNPMAMAKTVELMAKLNGLLIEKHDVRHAGFIVKISGLDNEPEDALDFTISGPAARNSKSELESTDEADSDLEDFSESADENPQSVGDSEMSSPTKEGES